MNYETVDGRQTLRRRFSGCSARSARRWANPSGWPSWTGSRMGDCGRGLITDLGVSKANLSKHMTLLVHGGIVESPT